MIAAMPHPLPKYVSRERARKGKMALYFRRYPGKRIRLRSPFPSPEFDHEYAAALAGKVGAPADQAKAGSLAWLWERYRDSGAWTSLSLATRRQRETIMRHVLKDHGAMPYRAITARNVSAGVDKRRNTPNQARHFLDTMRGMFKWALKAKMVSSDPTAGLEPPSRKKGGGFKIWTDDEVAKYEERWPEGTKERVWLHVLLYTGLRRGDACRIGKQHVRNGVATLRTEKSQGEVEVNLPILPVLQQTLDTGPTGDLAFICGERGTPFKKESFGNAFKKACRKAGVNANGKAAHGLRKVGATRAADAGATIHELMAIFGWRTEKEAIHYTQQANRRRLAARAMGMMVGSNNS